MDLLGEEIVEVDKRGRAFSHDRNEPENTKHEWLTPPDLLAKLGDFDLDPCAPVPERRPWPTAREHYDITHNGLIRPWHGRVWCNPPYDNTIARAFLGRCAEHGNSMVLIFARVETANWFEFIWSRADAVMFLRGRLKFYHASGSLSDQSAGAPSALIAYGTSNVAALECSGLDGHLVRLARAKPFLPCQI